MYILLVYKKELSKNDYLKTLLINSYYSRTRRIWADIYNQRGRRPSWLLDTLRSTFTADRKPLQVTWPDLKLAFTVNSPRFQRQEVGFRVSHLPQLLFAWIFCDPTYAWHCYTKKTFFFHFLRILILTRQHFCFHRVWTTTAAQRWNPIWRHENTCWIWDNK